uniref:Uncharacterized protein n=1 Tax=Plectus sambesii TaxID=2011161 RepID=A0A914UK40_9BILA
MDCAAAGQSSVRITRQCGTLTSRSPPHTGEKSGSLAESGRAARLTLSHAVSGWPGSPTAQERTRPSVTRGEQGTDGAVSVISGVHDRQHPRTGDSSTRP